MKMRIQKYQNSNWESIAVLPDANKDLHDPYLLIRDDNLVVYRIENYILHGR